MLSLRQSLTLIGKKPPIRVPGDVKIPCKSLRDTLIAWNHLAYPLLIITPQEFIEDVRPLADHKNSTGIITMLVSLEHIYEAYLGRDEAEKVKSFLALFQSHNGVKYAMLVGDGDTFPVRFVKWWLRPEIDGADPLSPKLAEWRKLCKAASYTAFVPSDLYYAALFKKEGGPFDDWDGNKDGYFGEVPPLGPNAGNGLLNPDDVHMIPILAVGRIPASTPDEVRIYVRKVIAYEKEAFGKDWTKAALLVSGDYGPPTKLNEIASKYLQGYKIHKLYWWPLIYNPDWGPKPQDVEDPTADKINAYINPPEGAKFVAYVGHGDHNAWAIGPDIWYSSHTSGVPGNSDPSDRGSIDDLVNWDRLPVVFSTGCDTGQFATHPPLLRYRDVYGVDHIGVYKGENFFPSTPPKPACLQPKDPSIAKDVESMAEGMTVERRKDNSNNFREKGTGAIAYMGNTVTGWEEGPELLDYFSKALTSKRILGDMWLDMMKAYYLAHEPPAPDKQAAQQDLFEYFRILGPWHFCLYGDPSLRVGGIPS